MGQVTNTHNGLKFKAADGLLESDASLTLAFDSDANSTGEFFRINSNIANITGTSGNATHTLMSIDEKGIVTFKPSFHDSNSDGTNTMQIGNGEPQIKATHSYQTIRLHYGSGSGFDIMGYSGQHLWLIGNSTFSEVVLSPSWSWDNQIGIRYTPGTIGQYSGVLAIGQITGEKNNTEYTHGLTRFYNRGVQGLELHHDGAIIKGNNSDASKLNFQIGHEGFQLLDSYDYKDGVRSNMTGLEIRTNNLNNANSSYPDVTVSALGRTTTSSGEGVIRIKNRRKYRRIRGYLKIRAAGSTDGFRNSSQAISGTTFMDGVAITGFDNAGSNETWIWGVVANNYDANVNISNKPSFIGNNYSEFLNNFTSGTQGDNPWTYWWNYSDPTGRPPVIIVTFERDLGTTQLDGDIEVRIMSDQDKGNEDVGIEQYAIWLAEEDQDYQRKDGTSVANSVDGVTKHVIGPHPHGQDRVGQLHIKQTQDSSVTGGDGIAIVRSATNDDIGYLNMTGGAFNIVSTGATPIKLRSGNGTTALTLDGSQHAVFAANVTASSGTGHFSVVNSTAYQLAGTYVMDSSRNLVNIGSATLSGELTINNNVGNNYSGIRIKNDTDAYSGSISFDTEYSGVDKNVARIFGGTNGSNGILYLQTANTSKVLTTALTLDYYQNASFAGNIKQGNIAGGNLEAYHAHTADMSDTSTYNVNKYYPVTIQGIGNGPIANIRVENQLNSNVPSWSTHGSGFSLVLDYMVNGNGWGTQYQTRMIRTWTERYASVTILGGIGQMTNSSTELLWLRGGGKYYIRTNKAGLTVTPRSSTFTANSQSVSPTADNTIVNAVYTSAASTMGISNIALNNKLEHAGDTDTYFQFAGDNDMKFITGGTERMRITGDVHVQGTTDFNINGANRRINFTSGTGTIRTTTANNLIFQTDSTTRFTIANNGTVTATGDVVAFSDKRLKSNVETLDGSKVYGMRGVSFIKDNRKSSGVIAQELEKVAPELVNNDSEYKSVAYGNITGYLIEAIKDLKQEITELKKQIK